MDKKNTILGLVFIGAGMGFMFWQSQEMQKQRLEELQQAETLTAPEAESTMPADAVMAPVEGEWESQSSQPNSAEVADLFEEAETTSASLPKAPATEETTRLLSNEYIESELTTRGGAIRR